VLLTILRECDDQLRKSTLAKFTPHPRPLSPVYRGEGSQVGPASGSDHAPRR
jgi:hypothetical protein